MPIAGRYAVLDDRRIDARLGCHAARTSL